MTKKAKKAKGTKGVYFEASPELREAFRAACKSRGLVEAQVFRAIMQKFVERTEATKPGG